MYPSLFLQSVTFESLTKKMNPILSLIFILLDVK